ncbi:histidine utilization repressor [Shewanella sp. NFH-SH190041]|uniref:histidine utilization repressor n=1 Tax=Shewanella sp. NFH-SH190041 TaxID=2950245 RepID=UPI0021C343D1|nr:histidine utilization repressor [Shewanella sp. NFH-SH190041]BDM62694.1 histidine utilization repressor [Shewanella sp. NFH-SH190041]
MPAAKFNLIKQHIIAGIEAGDWLEDTLVPSENQLAEQFSCSRMTARRALTELVDAGILTRVQGIGTFVASLTSQSSMLAIRNIADEIRERGHGYSVKVLKLEPISALPPIAIALGLESDSRVFHSLLLHCEQQQPLQLEERFVNPTLIPAYLQQDFSRITPHEYLSAIAPLTEARHIVEAIAATDELRHQLALKPGEPCLQILRRTWSSKGVVSFARLVHPGSRFRMGGHLTFYPAGRQPHNR